MKTIIATVTATKIAMLAIIQPLKGCVQLGGGESLGAKAARIMMPIG